MITINGHQQIELVDGIKFVDKVHNAITKMYTKEFYIVDGDIVEQVDASKFRLSTNRDVTKYNENGGL